VDQACQVHQGLRPGIKADTMEEMMETRAAATMKAPSPAAPMINFLTMISGKGNLNASNQRVRCIQLGTI